MTAKKFQYGNETDIYGQCYVIIGDDGNVNISSAIGKVFILPDEVATLINILNENIKKD